MGRRAHQINTRTWQDRLTAIRPLMVVIMLTCIGYIIWNQLNDPRTLPFKTIKVVTTADYIQPKMLQKIIAQQVHGGFFSLNIQALRDRVEAMSWVRRVSVRRVWPSTLVVTVIEQQPVARWGVGQLINSMGQLFSPPATTFPKNMPVLEGPPSMQQQVLAQFRTFSNELKPLHLGITSMMLTPRLAWQLQLSNGIVVMLGRVDVPQRFLQLVKLYPKVVGPRASQAESIDLRYPNGLAVRWLN